MTLTACSEYGLGIQGWAGRDTPDNRKITFAASGSPRPKPSDGFFTSTWDADRRSTPWLDFTRDGSPRSADGRSLWLLEPDADAGLYVIDSLEDFTLLAEAFPQRYDNPNDPRFAPDWCQMLDGANDSLAAVHVTEAAIVDGQRQPGSGNPQFTGWDVESTLWLSPRYKVVGSAGPIDETWSLSPSSD